MEITYWAAPPAQNAGRTAETERSMEFRPCIDIHNGKVKQIVGGSLRDAGDFASDNFVSGQDAAWYARLYRELGLRGGHIILLNPQSSEYYSADLLQARKALAAWPSGMQIGGGINSENAGSFLEAGASHVIVTSFVFRDGEIDWRHLDSLVSAVGRDHLVLDLSCRRKGGKYFIVTDRWQKFTDVEVSAETLRTLSSYCDEFLIHAADVEGRANGVERDLVSRLAAMQARDPALLNFPITYAGGVASYDDLSYLKETADGRIHVTVGSALDLFGGKMEFKKVLEYCSAPAR